MEKDCWGGQVLSDLGDVTLWGSPEAFWSKTCRIIRECLRPSFQGQKLASDEELLQQAHRELLEAHSRFSMAEEAELIDCAIYSLKAAEMRYDYLIRRIKQQRATIG